MNDAWYVQKGVELANGFSYEPNGKFKSYVTGPDMDYEIDVIPAHFKDALAAQLVRQVDASEYTFSSNVDHGASVGLIKHIEGQDRTMNTIRAIVDSKVLEGE